jgi:hypothetical protein
VIGSGASSTYENAIVIGADVSGSEGGSINIGKTNHNIINLGFLKITSIEGAKLRLQVTNSDEGKNYYVLNPTIDDGGIELE